MSDKVAIITGAGSGIGRETALAMLRAGYAVALAGRRAERLEETVQAAGEAGLDADRFNACLASGTTRRTIMDALDEAIRYGLHTSPSFLVNGRLAPAPPPFLPPFEFFTRLVEEELLRESRRGR